VAQPNVSLNLSTGALLASVLPETARQIVYKGDATIITPGVTGFDVVQLKTSALDTQYQTPPSEQLGVDMITFKPLTYPETTGE